MSNDAMGSQRTLDGSLQCIKNGPFGQGLKTPQLVLSKNRLKSGWLLTVFESRTICCPSISSKVLTAFSRKALKPA
jgi:hypothetical protein